MIFCDTSAIAKLYVPERESVAMRRLAETTDEVYVSELARAELMGVFHRRLREGKWSRTDFHLAIRQFSNDSQGGFWTWIPLDSSIIEAVANTYATLPETIFLRTADCLHLVTALQNNFNEIYTFDTHQANAAIALGMTVCKPSDPE